MYIKYMNYVD